MSAMFMAGAVVQVRGVGIDRGLPARWTAVVTVLFAVSPMIVFYGANGMSEAPFVFFLCWAVRRLIRWTSTDDVTDLMTAGVAFALGYLVRYDAIAAAAAGSLLVGVVSVMRHDGSLRDRLIAARMDVVLVAGPPLVAVFCWAAASWLLTGEAFAQFSSTYGNAAILAQSGTAAPDLRDGLEFVVAACTVMAPGLMVVVPVGLALAIRRREVGAAVPIIVCSTVIGFQVLAYLSGTTFGFLRFYIAVLPWIAVSVLLLGARSALPPARRPGAFVRERVQQVEFKALVPVGAAVMALGLITSWWGMTQPDLAPQEHALRVIIRPGSGFDDVALRDRELAIVASFSTERKIAEYLDSQALPEGSVLVDSVYGFAVTAASNHPQQFVIPSDRDFVTILNDPATAGIQYLLTVPPSGRGVSDALNRRYPSLYADGAGISLLELEVPNDGADQPGWRIYRIMPPAR